MRTTQPSRPRILPVLGDLAEVFSNLGDWFQVHLIAVRRSRELVSVVELLTGSSGIQVNALDAYRVCNMADDLEDLNKEHIADPLPLAIDVPCKATELDNRDRGGSPVQLIHELINSERE